MFSLFRRYAVLTLSLTICLVASSPLLKLQAAVKDQHSFANPEQISSIHLVLDVEVDFEKSELRGFVEHQLKRHDAKASTLVLDSRALVIEKVQQSAKGVWSDAAFSLGKSAGILGQSLSIELAPQSEKVRIYYHTTADSSGLQWLSAAQTSEKQQPFLFSQSQAIHARSWIPVQDTPAVRVSYQARVRTPKQLLAVMSADNSQNTERDGDYHFDMPQPIPAYLIAIAVGDLHFKAMSAHTGVYAEKTWLDKAANEFADTQHMMDVASRLYGQYPWGRYDLLILPASFPFGGMENPRLSFITPTVITGDKSLVSLIAHELAHSWSGNLITNSNWEDLWLNEGFTNFFENRIMAEVYGKARADMEYSLSVAELKRSLADLTKADQALKLQLQGRDPDEAFSPVAYVKGQLFLSYLEQQFGRENFDAFVSLYFKTFAFQSMDTQSFLTFLQKNLLDKNPGKVTEKDIQQWVFHDGLPDNYPKRTSDAFAIVEQQLGLFLAGKAKWETGDWAVHQWLHLLDKLPRDSTAQQLLSLDQQFALSQSQNAEIFVAWAKLAIPLQYEALKQPLAQFLTKVGRSKFVVPLYRAMAASPFWSEFGAKVYRQARPGYHPLTQAQVDKIYP